MLAAVSGLRCMPFVGGFATDVTCVHPVQQLSILRGELIWCVLPCTKMTLVVVGAVMLSFSRRSLRQLIVTTVLKLLMHVKGF